MKKKILKLILIFPLIILGSCGYEPLNKNFDLEKININEKIFTGNKRINKKIFGKLNLKEDNKISGYIIKLDSNKKIKNLSKDQAGNITSYKTTIITQVTLIKSQTVLKDKKFERNFTYSNLGNKFELSKYQREVENNIINGITQDLKVFLVE